MGQAVHDTIESLSVIPTDQRFEKSLLIRFSQSWEKVSGKMGGFESDEQEARYKAKGEEMIRKVIKNPGPIKNKAVKIQQDLPHFWLSEGEQIILCGKIDWLEYLEKLDAVHIIDFKTGSSKEDPNSLQLPIYLLLVANCQKRKVAKASYWYLQASDEPTQVTLPDLVSAEKQVLEIARKIKLFRKLSKFECPKEDGCFACKPFEQILSGEAEFVGTNDFGQDLYMIKKPSGEQDSVIL